MRWELVVWLGGRSWLDPRHSAFFARRSPSVIMHRAIVACNKSLMIASISSSVAVVDPWACAAGFDGVGAAWVCVGHGAPLSIAVNNTPQIKAETTIAVDIDL